MSPTGREQKQEQILGHTKNENLLHSKETINKTKIVKKTIHKPKRQPTEWEKIFANGISDKELAPKIYKDLIKLNTDKQIIQLRNQQKAWIDISPKTTCKWPTDSWKNVQHRSASGKCKSKPQWDTNSQLPEWLKLKTQEATDVGKDAEKGEPSCTVGGNANWCCHSRKLYGGSSTS